MAKDVLSNVKRGCFLYSAICCFHTQCSPQVFLLLCPAFSNFQTVSRFRNFKTPLQLFHGTSFLGVINSFLLLNLFSCSSS